MLSQVSQAASLVKLTCVAVSPGLNCCSRAVPRAVAVPQDRLLVVSRGPVLGRPSRTQCELYSGLSAASRVDPVDLSVLQDSVQLVKLFLRLQVFSRIWRGSCSRRPSAARSRRGSKPYYLYYNFFLHWVDPRLCWSRLYYIICTVLRTLMQNQVKYTSVETVYS